LRLRLGHGRLGRIDSRHLLALAGVALVAVSTAMALGLVQRPPAETAAVPAAIAPAWQTGAVLCREDPMASVPHPTRFVVLARCSTVSGAVRQVRRDPVDGELNLLVALDQPYSRFLLYGNQGLLRTVVVPRDIPKVTVPKVGQHATFYGSWVLDRTQRNHAAMHPVWMVQLSNASGGSVAGPDAVAEPRAAAAKRLWVQLQAPTSVPVGGAIDVVVRVESGPTGARRPLPEANLFFEVRDQDGRAVQWKATTTNALGRAQVTLVALEQPGSYRLWLYADKPGRSAVASSPVTVRRR
jgi:hypothetical protein